MKISKNLLRTLLFGLAIGLVSGAVMAKIKLQCVDRVCVEQCQASGGGNCYSFCQTPCED